MHIIEEEKIEMSFESHRSHASQLNNGGHSEIKCVQTMSKALSQMKE